MARATIAYLEQRYTALENEIADAKLRMLCVRVRLTIWRFADLKYRKLIIADEIQHHRLLVERFSKLSECTACRTPILLLKQKELDMSQSKIQQRSSDSAQELGDETFMSATELCDYMKQTEMAKALKDVGSSTDKARDELIKSLLQPVIVTPEKIAEVKRRVFGQLRTAAGKGDKELLVMRFPNALCTDKGRALNNLEKEWPSIDWEASSSLRVLARPPAAPRLRHRRGIRHRLTHGWQSQRGVTTQVPTPGPMFRTAMRSQPGPHVPVEEPSTASLPDSCTAANRTLPADMRGPGPKAALRHGHQFA